MTAPNYEGGCDRCTAGCEKCAPATIDLWPAKVPPKAGDVPDRVETVNGTEWHYYSGFGWMEPLGGES